MSKKIRLLVLIAGFVLLAPYLLSEESISIQVRLFRGTWGKDQPGLKQSALLTTSSNPIMTALKAKVGGPQNDFVATIIEILIDVMNLQKVDDLFSFEKPWDERYYRMSETVMLEQAAFLFNFTPKRVSPQKVRLQTVVFKTKEGSFLSRTKETVREELTKIFGTGKSEDWVEKILDKELVLEIGDPVIVGIAYKNSAYFIMILLRSGIKTPGEIVFSGGPKPVQKVIPAYPDELRKRGVEGEVKLQVAVDEDGTVQGVRVLKTLHPYLDNAAVQAIKQWKFEPVLQNGKPTPAILTMAVNFNKEAYALLEKETENKEVPPAGLDSSSKEELRMVLDQCAKYCQQLNDSALNYICVETIRDVFYNFHDKESLKKSDIRLLVISRIDYSRSILDFSFIPIRNLKRTEKNEYVCDYLLVKKGGRIEDRRIILEENGRKVQGRKEFLEEKRFSALMPLLAPSRLLGRNRQSLFSYRILKEQKVKGKRAYVIEALPKSGDAGGIEYGKIWVEKKSFQILKIEIEGVPLEGYESVLKETTGYNMKPKFTTTYLYQVEKKGLMFPSHLTIRVGYPSPGPSDLYLKKIKTDVNYDKYQFFTVEVNHNIIKKTSDTSGKI
jgi:TonB family protein